MIFFFFLRGVHQLNIYSVKTLGFVQRGNCSFIPDYIFKKYNKNLVDLMIFGLKRRKIILSYSTALAGRGMEEAPNPLVDVFAMTHH